MPSVLQQLQATVWILSKLLLAENNLTVLSH